MIYIATISILIFLGLIVTKYAYYKPLPDKAFLISGIIALFFSACAVADFVSEFINNLIEKYYGEKR